VILHDWKKEVAETRSLKNKQYRGKDRKLRKISYKQRRQLRSNKKSAMNV